MGSRALSSLAVGTKVFTNWSGSPLPFLIANQGTNTTLITENIHSLQRFDPANSNRFSTSNILSWLNSTFLNGFDDEKFTAEIQINPCPTAVNNGSYTGNPPVNVNTKIYLPGYTEVGLGSLPTEGSYGFSYAEGTKLELFDDTVTYRIATYNGVAASWWLRSAYIGNNANNSTKPYYITPTGTAKCGQYSYVTTIGIRPCLDVTPDILISDTLTDNGYEIVFKNPPDITGSNINIGTILSEPSYTYSVSHVENLTLSVTERIDNTVINTRPTAIYEKNYTAEVPLQLFRELSEGTHTLIITTLDSEGMTADRIITFNLVKLHCKLTMPLSASAMPRRININTVAEIPLGCKFEVYTCNNANDTSPTWEEATTAVLQHNAYVFTNKVKTATSWGINVLVIIYRGSATGNINLSGIGGNFE